MKTVSDKTLRQAFGIYTRTELEYYEEDARKNPHVFSKHFERKMEKLLAARRKSTSYFFFNKTWKRILITVVLSILLLLASIISVAAWRKSLFEFFIRIYEDFSHVVVLETENMPLSGTGFVEYEISEPMDGFELLINYVDTDHREKYSKYRCGDKILIFRQMDAFAASFDIETAGGAVDIIHLSGQEYHYYHHDDINNIMWNNGAYIIMLSGNIDKDKLLDLAKATKMKIP